MHLGDKYELSGKKFPQLVPFASEVVGVEAFLESKEYQQTLHFEIPPP